MRIINRKQLATVIGGVGARVKRRPKNGAKVVAFGAAGAPAARIVADDVARIARGGQVLVAAIQAERTTAANASAVAGKVAPAMAAAVEAYGVKPPLPPTGRRGRPQSRPRRELLPAAAGCAVVFLVETADAERLARRQALAAPARVDVLRVADVEALTTVEQMSVTLAIARLADALLP